MILIANTKSEVRKQHRQALKKIASMHEATTLATLEQSLTKLKPSVLLLDSDLRNLRGIEGVRSVHRLSPPTKIIFITSKPSENEAISALKAGAVGYCCNEDINPSSLKKAVEMVQKGEIWVSRNLVRRLVDEVITLSERQPKVYHTKLSDQFRGLTPREREVVQSIAVGGTNRDIGNRLKISEKTVKRHLTSIFRKFNVSGRLRLALFIAEHVKVSPPKARHSEMSARKSN
jgi:two-component system, NarL family, nitrate/nitrite response regulator NarL